MFFFHSTYQNSKVKSVQYSHAYDSSHQGGDTEESADAGDRQDVLALYGRLWARGCGCDWSEEGGIKACGAACGL